jgi:hypothetical protein
VISNSFSFSCPISASEISVSLLLSEIVLCFSSYFFHNSNSWAALNNHPYLDLTYFTRPVTDPCMDIIASIFWPKVDDEESFSFEAKT